MNLKGTDMTLLNPIRIFALLASALLLVQLALTPAGASPVGKPSSIAFQPTRFSVTVVGKGPDVILIPGLASSGSVWDATVAQLKAKYRLHVVQVAGFAGTPARGNAAGTVITPLVGELHDYIGANKLKSPAVIGHSMGGLAALMLAADYSGDVGKVMIVDALPWYGMLFGPQANVEGVKPQAAAMRDALIKGGQESYAASSPRSMARLVKSKTPAAQAAIAAGAASHYDVVARAFYEDMITDVRPRLANIKTPVTAIYAWDETMGLPQAVMDGLYASAYAALPTKVIKRIDGSYHFIMIDQPEAFAREVVAFLGK
jgi:pimeloyl-ACP methyl ester carboxylesterase